MVVHRRPTEIQAEVPTSVYALDLQRLSALLQIPQNELISGFHAHPTASEIHGVVVDAGEEVPFENVGHVEEKPTSALAPFSTSIAIDHDPILTSPLRSRIRTPMATSTPGRGGMLSPITLAQTIKRTTVRQVLLTAAVRPDTLDVHGNPKCLLRLGSQTILVHILTQLYAAAIERVVIAVGAGGAKIITAAKRTPFYVKMTIEFLDLGETYSEGHARSILAAQKMFTNKTPFLIHTADHIFDKSIISKITNFQLNDAVACVLVETDTASLTMSLPPTAVRVQCGKETVTKIGRDLKQFDGIDAGLFLSSVAIFGALADLADKKAYFSLADALSYFTKFNKLLYLSTAGETWFSIETEEQLAYTKDTDGVSVLSPWTVFLASTAHAASNDPLVTKNVVIGVSAVDQDASLRVAGKTDTSCTFEGFVVGVSNSDNPIGAPADDDYDNDFMPLLSRRGTFLSSARSTKSHFSRNNSFIEQAGADESFVVSFPVADETSKTFSNHRAYLIEMSPDPMNQQVSDSQYMLAVPGVVDKPLPTPPSTFERLERHATMLPTDITHISLETKGYDENLEVVVVVERQAPLIGYLLLFSSLITLSSVGVALDIVENVESPLLKLFWRNCATSLTALPLALLAIRRNGPPLVTPQLVLTMLAAGASYAFYLGSYVISLSLTSVGHATLFNNAHSLLLVLVKIVTRQPIVLFEGLGAAVGVIGGAITTMDPKRGSDEHVVSPTAYGDIIALIGALGGAIYFVLAKKLRSQMDLVLFMHVLTAISALVLLITMLLMGENISFSTDMYNGIFGWVNLSSNRLLTVCYLVFICDLIGTMGYVSVMKYFDPIVISVFCLLEPIVATGMGIVMGVDSVPGILTFVGSALVIGGTYLVITTQSQKTEQINATETIVAADSTPKPLYSTRVKKRVMNYGSVN